MTKDRGAEIEKFYWVILNLLLKVFAWLLMISGGLFAVSFGVERLRDGVMSFNGKVLTEWSDQWPLLAGGAVVFLVGLLLLKILPIGLKKEQKSELP